LGNASVDEQLTPAGADMYPRLPAAGPARAWYARDDQISARQAVPTRHPALRAMFNDAMSAKAGRLIATNPLANLGISRGTGNKHRKPPTEEELARDASPRARADAAVFAAYLEAGCLTAITSLPLERS
jgi:hypothetical protein